MAKYFVMYNEYAEGYLTDSVADNSCESCRLGLTVGPVGPRNQAYNNVTSKGPTISMLS